MDFLFAKLVTPRSSHWPAVRAAYLELHPTCAATGLTTDLEIHHVHPFHLYHELELDPTNFITLTEHASFNAHLWIGHGGNWKDYNPFVRKDAAQMLDRIKKRLSA